MPSPSTTGRFACAATIIGDMLFEPPISAHVTWVILRPRCVSSARSETRNSSPCSGALITYDRSADRSDRSNKRVVRHLACGNHLDRFALIEELLCLEFTEVGITAAAGAENASADRQAFEIVPVDSSRHVASCSVLGEGPWRRIARAARQL